MLLAALARAAKWQLSEFNPQEVANTAWAFATVNYRDEKLFAALSRVSERRLSEFKPQEVSKDLAQIQLEQVPSLSRQLEVYCFSSQPAPKAAQR